MKKIICTLLVFVMLLPTVAFADYNVSDWAKEEVSRAEELALIPSVMDVDLTANITRAEFTGIAVELFTRLKGGYIYRYGGEFTDIENNPYEQYIRCAYYYGITNGTEILEDGTVVFSPDEEITREELATMLSRVVKKVMYDDWSLIDDASYPLDVSDAPQFYDHVAISKYAKEAVQYMAKKGIVNGVVLDNPQYNGENFLATYFLPLGTATREQAVAIALRIYDDMYKESQKDVAKTTKFESYIGKSFEDIKAEFGEPEYAFSFDGWHYIYYNFGEVSFAFESTRFFVPADGTPVYPDGDFYEEPVYGVKGVLVTVNDWLDGILLNYTLDEVNERSGLNFIPAVEHWGGNYYTTAYDSENVIQYLIKNEGTTIKGDDQIFIQDFSHNVYNPKEEE